jgi:hypothetical protein
MKNIKGRINKNENYKKIMIFIQYEKHEKAVGVVAVVSRP